MLMTVKFQGAPPLDEVRSSLSKVLASPPSVQTFENGSNEIAIGTEGSDDATLAKNHQLVLDTLAKTFGHPDNGKLDLNNASAAQRGRPAARSAAEGGRFAFRSADRSTGRGDCGLSQPARRAAGEYRRPALRRRRDAAGDGRSEAGDVSRPVHGGARHRDCRAQGGRGYAVARRSRRRCWRWPECWCISGSGSNGFTARPR